MRYDNLWWIIIAAFWIAFTAFCLFIGEYLTATLGLLGLVGLLCYARVAVNQRRTIHYQRAAIASLQQSLKEAHRHDYR